MTGGTLVVLQARMGSRRLPGKSLALIGGATLVELCAGRLAASGVGSVLLATTTDAEDDPLAAEASRLGIGVLRGSRDDVLDRFLQAVRRTDAEFVVRATADNPAIDVDGVRRVVRELRLGADYCHERLLPYGAAVEGIRSTALVDAGGRATRADDREHVTTYVRRHETRYRLAMPEAPRAVQRPDLRLTVDTQADADYMRAIARSLPGGLATAGLPAIIEAADAISGNRGANAPGSRREPESLAPQAI